MSLLVPYLPPALLEPLTKLDTLPAWVPLAHDLARAAQGKTHQYAYLGEGAAWVDWKRPELWAAVGMVFFNPIYWNLVARNEYRNKTLTKVFGSPYLGCYFLGATIFSLGIVRDVIFERALRTQPSHPFLAHPLIQILAYVLIALGQLFVITSIYALGFTGTYLGDYFGILMKARVTGFPFNVLNDPMYVGSTMAFIGGALVYQSPAGLGLAGLVWMVYVIALEFEGPFTSKIYSSSAASKKTDAPAPAPTGTTPAAAPSTPRKSSRLAKASNDDLSGSYAAAAAKTPAPDADALAEHAPPKAKEEAAAPLPAQTPRARRIRKESVAPEGASPARMTRSRSKGRLGSETE